MISKVALRFLSTVIAAIFICSSYAAEPKRGGSLRLGMQKGPTTLNPLVQTRSTDHKIRTLLYEGLLEHGQNLESLPGLATAWEISPNGLTYTFTLRSGAKFHDGKSVSPQDVKWSIDYARDPKNSAQHRTDLAPLREVEVIGC